MDFSLLFLVAAFGGGLFGAAIGGIPAFVFTGFAVLVGVGVAISGADYDFLGNVAFGPVFGPHIAFGGAVAATAFAKQQGYIEDGKAITTGLMGLDKPLVLLVGGAFGVLGYLINFGIANVLGRYTDTVALTVVVSAVIARLAFGNLGLFGTPTDEARERGRFNPGGGNVWVPYQQDWVQISVIGVGVGMISSFMYISIANINESLASSAGVFLGFGVAAVSLVLLVIGVEIPVTHHIALPGAYGTMIFFPIMGSSAIIVGVIGGVLGAIVAEVAARLFLIHGDTFVDPPANGIWIIGGLFFVIGVFLGTN